MTVDRLDGRIFDLLTELSLPRVPDYIDDTLRQTARTRQRPGWTFPQRWLPMDTALRVPVGMRQVPWRTIGILALLVIALAVAILAIGSRPHRLPAPFGPAANGALLYDRAGDIFMADSGLAHEAVLVGGETNDYAARWSRDGSRFFFARETDGGLFVMAADVDGHNVREISSHVFAGPEGYDLSPASDELALIDAASGTPKLSILSLAGGGTLRDVDIGSIEAAKFVAWRPGASDELLFAGHPDGDQTALGLYAVHPDGSGLRPLILQQGESTDPASVATQYSFNDVSLSSDGSTAVYWNWQTTLEADHSCFIHALDLATGHDRRLTLDPSASCEMLPVFTPDAKSIVAESGSLLGVSQTFVIPMNAGDIAGAIRPIGPTYSYAAREGFAISPDGTKVLFIPVGGNAREIAIATGAAVDSQIPMYGVPSWQRLAP
jgi:Tol biopolymer transport system component